MRKRNQQLFIESADLLEHITKYPGTPAAQPDCESVFPFIFPAIISGLIIAVVILRPVLLGLGIWMISVEHPFGWFCLTMAFSVLVFHILTRRAQTQPGVHVSRPLTKLQDRVVTVLKKYETYQPPVFYDCGYFCTVFPFFAYHLQPPGYRRQWVAAKDGQNVCIDWLLPKSGRAKQVVILLHGANGNADTNYIVDCAQRFVEKDILVACMVNRGLGDCYVTGPPEAWFSSARICDIKAVVEAVEAFVQCRVPINLLGFSNGGIMMSNYVARLGEGLKDRINACMCVSVTINAASACQRLSSRIWQAPIVWLLMKKFIPRLCAGAGMKVPKDWLSMKSIMELDEKVIVPYQGFETIAHYYNHFSIGAGHWRDVSIPTLILHARDDPVFHVDDTVLPEVYVGNSNIYFLVTATGGHVGWPSPHSLKDKWQFIADLACDFYDAVILDYLCCVLQRGSTAIAIYKSLCIRVILELYEKSSWIQIIHAVIIINMACPTTGRNRTKGRQRDSQLASSSRK